MQKQRLLHWRIGPFAAGSAGEQDDLAPGLIGLTVALALEYGMGIISRGAPTQAQEHAATMIFPVPFKLTIGQLSEQNSESSSDKPQCRSCGDRNNR